MPPKKGKKPVKPVKSKANKAKKPKPRAAKAEKLEKPKEQIQKPATEALPLATESFLKCCLVCNENEEGYEAMLECGTCGMSVHPHCFGEERRGGERRGEGSSAKKAKSSTKAVKSTKSAAVTTTKKLDDVPDPDDDMCADYCYGSVAVSGQKRKRSAVSGGQFTCCLCSSGCSRCPACALCGSGFDNRAMKPLASLRGKEGEAAAAAAAGLWCHVACVQFSPHAHFVDADTMDGIDGVEAAVAASRSQSCALCRRSDGAKVKCHDTACPIWMHVMCARSLGWGVSSSDAVTGKVQHTMLCGSHMSDEQLAAKGVPCCICARDVRGSETNACMSCGSLTHAACLADLSAGDGAGEYLCKRCSGDEGTSAVAAERVLPSAAATKKVDKKAATTKALIRELAPKLEATTFSDGRFHVKHVKETCTWHERQMLQLPFLYRLVHEGASLLLYGLGSKRNILLSLAARLAPSVPVLELDGASPACTTKAATSAIEMVLKSELKEFGKKPQRKLVEDPIAATLAAYVASQRKFQLMIAIHSADYLCRRDPEFLKLLRTLAQTMCIRIVASADSWKFWQAFDDRERSAGRWLSVHWATFEPYTVECGSQADKAAVGVSTTSGLSFVLQSLTRVHHQILRLLIDLTSPSGASVSRSDLFEECRGAMLTSNESTLRQYLVELLDHRIIAETRGKLSLVVSADSLSNALDTVAK